MGLTKICYRFFNNLSNPTRLSVLEALMERPMGVGKLTESLGKEQSITSHNFKTLLRCDFVAIERQGKKRVHSANKETLTALFERIANHSEKHCPTQGKCLAGGIKIGSKKDREN